MSSQLELEEAFRLYELNKDSELLIHGKIMSLDSQSSSVCPHPYVIVLQILIPVLVQVK